MFAPPSHAARSFSVPPRSSSSLYVPLLDDSTIRYLDEGEAGSPCLEGVEDANEIRIRFGRCVVQMFGAILEMLFALFVST